MLRWANAGFPPMDHKIDGRYGASVQVGNEVEYGNYVVRDGKVEAQ